jgi:two-component system KDP operon response regulator KdpE
MRRRDQAVGGSLFRIDDLTVDLARRLTMMAGNEVQLSPTEYDLLQNLVVNAGKVLTHHHLLREVWGPGYDGELHLLRVTISNLRRKLEPDPTRPHYILTEPGVGYRLRVNP